jgi:hypothetical protein
MVDWETGFGWLLAALLAAFAAPVNTQHARFFGPAPEARLTHAPEAKPAGFAPAADRTTTGPPLVFLST